MSNTTSLTSKGQVTIPKALRDELGLKPFDRIEFEACGDGAVRLRKAGPSLEDVVGSLPAIGISVEEAIERAREERAEYYAREYLSMSE